MLSLFVEEVLQFVSINFSETKEQYNKSRFSIQFNWAYFSSPWNYFDLSMIGKRSSLKSIISLHIFLLVVLDEYFG